jgi:hypothetical protein
MQSLNLTDEVGKLAEIGRAGARANRAHGSDKKFYISSHPNYSYNPDFIFIHKKSVYQQRSMFYPKAEDQSWLS